MEEKLSNTISIRLSETQLKKLKAKAKAERRKPSEIVRWILEDYLNNKISI